MSLLTDERLVVYTALLVASRGGGFDSRIINQPFCCRTSEKPFTNSQPVADQRPRGAFREEQISTHKANHYWRRNG